MLMQSIDEKQANVQAEDDNSDDEIEEPKGTPHFWLTVFKNMYVLSGMIQEYNESVLKHLQEVNVKCSEREQPMNFTLEFKFKPNEYFTNEVITKVYQVELRPDKLEFSFFDEP
ncbi:nucleosome assembly protein 1-like 1 [Scyliorhinus canicula]|uniref:nucleosome assembly protein 1-like 1 n=1 Tax=Scyliorhinus canicula TaxID=7830 RepID=UPI0018F77783|nr:nucleosome assembly protein 1-like 1 [Scyliorhinus canicula]